MAAPQPIDSRRRKEQQDAIAAALLLIYHGAHADARKRLGQPETEPTPQARAKIHAFAAGRAQKIADGTNSRLAAASEPESDTTPHQAQGEIDAHNRDVLVPFMARWAQQQGLLDAYRETPDPRGSGQSALDAAQWVWTRVLDNPPQDDCQDADDLGPSSLDEIFAVTGGPPPLHPNCACFLGPV